MAPGGLAALQRAAVDAARTGRHDRAAELFAEIAEAHPGLWWAPYNAGLMLLHLGRTAEAEAALAEAVRRAPDRAEAHADHAAALLGLGRETEGWIEYLWRREAPRLPEGRPRAPLPADLRGRSFVLLNEQGLGDALFFLRYAAALRDRGARLFHDPFPKLAGVLSRVAWLEPISRRPPDERIPLGDLPFLTGASAPPALPLMVLPEAAAAVERHLARLGPGPYLGVTWHAGTPGGAALVKDVPPALLGRAASAWPGTVVILQRTQAPSSVAAFRDSLGREAADLSALSERLELMLALLDRLEAYAAVSNTNIHLRAGLGRASHVLVPWPAEFRWRAGSERSPWFPDCPLHRQEADGDWGRALAGLAAALSSGGA